MAAHSEGARKSRLRADRSGSLDDSVSSDEETAELFGGRHDHNDDDDSESVKSPSITRDNGKSNKRKGKKDKKNGKNGKNDKDDNDNSDNDDNDDEEDDANPLLDLLPDWLRPCKLLERQFNDNIDCEFQVVVPLLVEREITFSIDYTDEICDPIGGLICVTPGFFGGFDFDDLIVSSGFGFYDIR